MNNGEGGSKIGCFNCKEKDHWVKDCPYANFPCVLGCSSSMRVLVSNTIENPGRKFLRCKMAQTKGCTGFKWLDEVELCKVGMGKGVANEEDMNKEEDKLKLHINRKIAMSVEGSVENICKIVKKLSME